MDLSLHSVRAAIRTATINPDLLTCAGKLHYDGYVRLKEMNAVIKRLSEDAVSIKEIERRTGHSRKFVRHVIRGEMTDVFRLRQSSLDVQLPLLDDMWNAGRCNSAELWRRLKAKGFCGSLRVVGEWETRRRRAKGRSNEGSRNVPSARRIERMMTITRDQLCKSDTVTIANIEAGAPLLVEARDLTDGVRAMIGTKPTSDFEAWALAASRGMIASFAGGITPDRAAVEAAITEHLSNGQAEGQMTRLKLVMRQMYGKESSTSCRPD